MTPSFWKISLTLLVFIQITETWRLVCFHKIISNFKSVIYTNAKELITSGYFNVTKLTLVYAHGYKGSTNTQGTDKMINTCLQKPDMNCCAVDYPDEANYGTVPFANFPIVVAKAYQVQRELAEALVILWQNGMKPECVHMMGFSLGAHVCGNAARTFSQLTNMKIGRTTGLDPAKPSYDGAISMNPRIDQTCANFVDNIHSDTRYGMETTTGHADYLVNRIEYKETGVQPGCDPVNYIDNPPFTPEDACSHLRPVFVCIESWGDDSQLLAAQALDEYEWGSPGFVAAVVNGVGFKTNQTDSDANVPIAKMTHCPGLQRNKFVRTCVHGYTKTDGTAI